MTRYDEHFNAAQTRRQLLRRAGAVTLTAGVAPALLSACGGEDEAQAPQASGPIDFLSWEGYDLPTAMKDWKQQHGVSINANYVSNHDDIQAKILAAKGAQGFDLITYYHGYKPLYSELEILEPLDESRLPSLKNLSPYFAGDQGNFWVDEDGTRTGVPFTWGSYGITYDSAEVSGLRSYYDLLDSKFTGKIGTVDDPVGNFGLAAHILGYDSANVTPDQNEEIKDLLSQMIAQTKGVSPSYGDLTTKLVSGEIVATWPGWAAMNQFAAGAGKDTIRTTLPEEGSMSYVDAYAIPPTTDNLDTTYAWINQSLDPKVNAKGAEALGGGVTVEGALQFLDKAIAELYPYGDLEGLFERAPLYNNAPFESDEFVTFPAMLEQWQELKAQA